MKTSASSWAVGEKWSNDYRCCLMTRSAVIRGAPQGVNIPLVAHQPDILLRVPPQVQSGGGCDVGSDPSLIVQHREGWGDPFRGMNWHEPALGVEPRR